LKAPIERTATDRLRMISSARKRISVPNKPCLNVLTNFAASRPSLPLDGVLW